MKKSLDVVPSEHQDTFLRVYPRVLADTNLTLLQKLILSDIISFQLRGMTYFKSSSELAQQLGYSTKSIQSVFQQLAKLGYIRTSLKEGNKKNHSLRQASVHDMEYWVSHDKHLNGRSRISPAKPSKSIRDGIKAPEAKPEPVDVIADMFFEDDEISLGGDSIKSQVDSLPVDGAMKIDYDKLLLTYETRDEVLEMEKAGKKLEYIMANIYDNGIYWHSEDVLKYTYRATGRVRYIPRSFMEHPPVLKTPDKS